MGIEQLPMSTKTKTLLALATVFLFIQAAPVIQSGLLDLGILYEYEDTFVPEHVFFEDTFTEDISNEVTTLGRVLFYDQKLSLNSSVSCASCHKQEFAFGDTLVASPGFDEKLTERHSTRLLNINYNHMPEVFWDMRAKKIDSLSLMVLSNSIEMGFSGENGQPPIDSLMRRLDKVDYYEDLFMMAFGDSEITEQKVNAALTQFVRSIESYDSRYDIGRTMVEESADPFPNFTAEENHGKELFLSPFSPELENNSGPQGPFDPNGPQGPQQPSPTEHLGKMGCAQCHGIDNFTIRKTSLTGHNGITGVIGHPSEIDTTVKRSPSLRNLFDIDCNEIGPFMHDGSLSTLMDVMDHYSEIGLNHPNKPVGLHSSLNVDAPNGTYQGPGGPAGPTGPIFLPERINDSEKLALIAFLKTLNGKDIFTNEKWSDPFSEDGELILVNDCNGLLTSTIKVEICEGENYHGFYQTGNYQKRFKNANDCDSVLLIDLTVIPAPEKAVDITICESENYLGVTTQGSHVILKEGTAGCDTILFLDLKVTPADLEYRWLRYCEGKQVEEYDMWGVYDEYVDNEKTGCYTLIRSQVSQNHSLPSIFEEIQICRGESYRGYSEEGYYYDTLFSQLYCDTVFDLDLIVLDPSESIVEQTICAHEEFEGYNISGRYADVFSNAVGCDSTRYLELTVIADTESMIEASICEGENYEGYTVSGDHIDQLTNTQGCDSLRHISLTVNKPTESFISMKICRGEVFEGYTDTGAYEDLLVNALGCDSVRIIDLEVLEHSEFIIDIAICEGEEFEGYKSAGSFTDIFQNAVGCDSTRVINLELLSHTSSVDHYSICRGENIWGYEEAGYYEDVLVNVTGCDSMRYLELEILEHTESYEEVHLCPNESFESYIDGDHEEYYSNAQGCDSTRYISILNIDPTDAICEEKNIDSDHLLSETEYISVYPNPVFDIMNVRIDKPERTGSEVRIYDTSHNLVLYQEVEGNMNELDLSQVPSGVYIVQIVDGLNKYVGRVVKL